MKMRNVAVAAALAAGVALRVAALPLPGTTDVPIFNAWAHFASTEGVAGLYGTGGVYPERRLLEFDGVRTKVDYPPLALYALALAGPKALSVAADAAIAILLFFFVRRWSDSRDTALWTALAAWLNPASILIGSVLGYLDPLFVLPAVAAVIAAAGGRGAAAGALLAAACLVKPLGILLAPCIAMALGPKRLMMAAVAALAVTAIVVTPIALHGGLLNMSWSVGSLVLNDPFLSGNGASLWALASVWMPAASVHVMRAAGAMVTAAAVGWAMFIGRGLKHPWLFAALGAFTVHAYATLAVSVHENHLFAAVPLLALACSMRPRFTRLGVAVSAIVTANLYLAYGFGLGVRYAAPDTIAGIDTIVLLSIVNAAVFAWHAAVWRAECAAVTPPGPRGSRNAPGIRCA